MADLHRKTIRERMNILIMIAHPNFRESLKAKAYELCSVPRLFAGAVL
ncbi:MAG: acetyl-CoA hydrolase/transferase C-terminal domain-containing protein [bacterium]|nr:acetyl-CoA hydrolase/transferase C-terminal domain-containing protein [bacterium]